MEVASIKSKSRSFSLLFYASTWQSRSRVRASPALSRRRVIPRLSMVRVRYVAALLVAFFYYFFRDSFFLERRPKNQEKEKRKVGRRREKETKSRVAMATIKRSFAKRHSESTLCRSFPVHTLLFPLLFFSLKKFNSFRLKKQK